MIGTTRRCPRRVGPWSSSGPSWTSTSNAGSSAGTGAPVIGATPAARCARLRRRRARSPAPRPGWRQRRTRPRPTGLRAYRGCAPELTWMPMACPAANRWNAGHSRTSHLAEALGVGRRIGVDGRDRADATDAVADRHRPAVGVHVGDAHEDVVARRRRAEPDARDGLAGDLERRRQRRAAEHGDIGALLVLAVVDRLGLRQQARTADCRGRVVRIVGVRRRAAGGGSVDSPPRACRCQSSPASRQAATSRGRASRPPRSRRRARASAARPARHGRSLRGTRSTRCGPAPPMPGDTCPHGPMMSRGERPASTSWA